MARDVQELAPNNRPYRTEHDRLERNMTCASWPPLTQQYDETPHDQLQYAMNTYGGEPSEWVDCSLLQTPYAYPLSKLFAEPQLDFKDSFLDVCRTYYGCLEQNLLSIANVSQALKQLAYLKPIGRVGILSAHYRSQLTVWHQAGHEVEWIHPSQLEYRIEHLDVLVISNPDLPTGTHYPAHLLRRWWSQLQWHGGWLVIDERLADIEPCHSMMPYTHQDGLIVLRSMQHFFGRLGTSGDFAAASTALLSQLRLRLPPRPNHDPLCVRAMCLGAQDGLWQQQQKRRIWQSSQWLHERCQEVGLKYKPLHPMMHYCPHPRAKAWHYALARQKIWTRYYADSPALGLGLIHPHQYAKFAYGLYQAAQEILG